MRCFSVPLRVTRAHKHAETNADGLQRGLI